MRPMMPPDGLTPRQALVTLAALCLVAGAVLVVGWWFFAPTRLDDCTVRLHVDHTWSIDDVTRVYARPLNCRVVMEP